MFKSLLQKKFSKQILTKKFNVDKNPTEVDRILHLIAYELGYRFVTGYHWEVAGPSSMSLYRQKWIPERYLDIQLNETGKDSTGVELSISYILTKKSIKIKLIRF